MLNLLHTGDWKVEKKFRFQIHGKPLEINMALLYLICITPEKYGNQTYMIT